MDKLSGSWRRALTQGLNPQKDSALESCFLPGTGRPNNTSEGAFKDSSKARNQRCTKEKYTSTEKACWNVF